MVIHHENDSEDPRHVFLDAHDVLARYGWGKTKGYRNLKDRTLVPSPIMEHPMRWRLDQLLAWEDKLIAESMKAPTPRRADLASLLPPPKQGRRAG